ncbi:MAG: hypothetical protein ABWK01_02125 [Infirmifilum sp.]
MPKRVVTVDQVKGALCTLVTTKEGGFKLIAKAAPYGTRGKVFASVINADGKPVIVRTPEEARNYGCADVRIPNRKVPKRKIGNRELSRLGLDEMAYLVKEKSKKHGNKGIIGFAPSWLIKKIIYSTPPPSAMKSKRK